MGGARCKLVHKNNLGIACEVHLFPEEDESFMHATRKYLVEVALSTAVLNYSLM